MNQMHGIEMRLNNKETPVVEIKDCLIEDNFCDGINISNQECSSIFESVPKRKQMKSLKADARVPMVIENNKIISNKNTGLMIASDASLKRVKLTLSGNVFENNLCADIECGNKNASEVVSLALSEG